jgi:hypothetical protein
MKEKKDCKECGAPLKDWQVKQGYDLCLECYKSKRKTSHEILKEDAMKEENEEKINDESEREDVEEEEEVEEVDLGEDNEHLEDEDQGEEEE